MSKFKISCTPENAPKFYEWIQTRGGIYHWRSANLSNPGASWSTPADVQQKPTWQAEDKPEFTVTSADEIGVYEDALYKAFPVRLKRGGGMFSLVLADSSQRVVDRVMEKCREEHGDAFYRKGVLDDCDASIGVYYTTREISLTEWIKNNPK